MMPLFIKECIRSHFRSPMALEASFKFGLMRLQSDFSVILWLALLLLAVTSSDFLPGGKKTLAVSAFTAQKEFLFPPVSEQKSP